MPILKQLNSSWKKNERDKRESGCKGQIFQCCCQRERERGTLECIKGVWEFSIRLGSKKIENRTNSQPSLLSKYSSSWNLVSEYSRVSYYCTKARQRQIPFEVKQHWTRIALEGSLQGNSWCCWCLFVFQGDLKASGLCQNRAPRWWLGIKLVTFELKRLKRVLVTFFSCF